MVTWLYLHAVGDSSILDVTGAIILTLQLRTLGLFTVSASYMRWASRI